MSAQTTPISPERFAAALRDLQLSSLHAKAAEIRNSMAHLQRSNDELQPLAAEGDKDCGDAFWENLQVIKRMEERLNLVKAEVEGRGFLWDVSEVGEPQPGQLSPPSEDTLATAEGQQSTLTAAGSLRPAPSASTGPTGGTLDDNELRRRLAEQLGDEDDGVHL